MILTLKRFVLFTALVLIVLKVNSQAQEEFNPYGEPTLRFFGNFHSGLTPADNNRVFEVERAYLGYHYFMSNNFLAEIKVDIGSPENESVYALVKRYAYFRNAYVKYHDKQMEVAFGIINMTHFNVQESFWENRYLMKSYADEYKFGKSADLGLVVSYKISDYLSADVSMVNGEGYSQLQHDNYFEYCAGTTFQWLGKLVGRLYVNYGPSEKKSKMVYAAFLGYRFSEKISLGAEYNLLTNYKYFEGRDQYGFSIYSTWKMNKKWKVFGRYDVLESNLAEDGKLPWNLVNDGSCAVIGVEHKINQFLKLAVNYRDWYPKAANMDNRAYLYVNVEFKL